MAPPLDLDTPLRSMRGGLDARTAKALDEALGLRTVGDLLAHLPRRYDERGELTDLADLRPGEQATVLAEVTRVSGRRIRAGLHKLDVIVTDGRHRLTLTFFNKPWLERALRPGMSAYFAGKVEKFRGKTQVTNPEVQPLGELDDVSAFAGAVMPVYPSAGKVASWTVARSVRVVLDPLTDLPDPLPADLRGRHGLPDLIEAYRLVHRPEKRSDVVPGLRRLKWDEAMVLQVALAQRRRATENAAGIPRPGRPDGLRAAFDSRLPFTLTRGQREVGAVLDEELARPHPMHRLLQGEVGSGKTVVALRAMLRVADSGGQCALLAPTEVLAVQHERSLRALLGPLARAGELALDAADEAGLPATRVVALTGSMSAARRRDALAALRDGSAGVVVGTHALLQESVTFADLGLVVVDEQHRFGVEQRDALRARADRPPHVLVMTATPIPRTVAMTVFGDLETSSLTELPAGRQPVATFVVPAGNPAWVERMWGRVRDEAAAGHAAFVVCPRIGDGPARDEEMAGDDLPATDAGPARPPLAVVDVAVQAREALPGLRVGVLHGRLPAEEKDAAMDALAAGGLDVLVATTVVEVGVDVPRATVMVVMDADRFGVSQLHQLRGRVGRGGDPSWCLLHTEAPADSTGYERLAAVAATTDGARLARLDLRQRREGDVLGVAQSGGRRRLQLLELLSDEQLIAAAREEAVRLVSADPELNAHPLLAAALAARLDETSAAYLEKG